MPDESNASPEESEPRLGDLIQVLGQLPNSELMATLDEVLLELERRLLHYARSGRDILQMADEGLVLAVRARARLTQAQSAAHHAESHLQILGVGNWKPRTTQPSWNTDPRVTGDDK